MKSLRNRLVAILLIIGLMIAVFPVRNTIASEMATYSYVNSDDEFILSVSDSNGNVIEVGDSVKVGTEITIRIIAPEYYETNVGDCITVEYGDYYDWEYIYLDEKSRSGS